MSLIPGYEKGADITVINTTYVSRKKLDDGSVSKDFIMIVFRDNVTGEKKFHIIYEPEYEYYVLKNGYQVGYNLFFIEKDKVEPVKVKYRDLILDIAKKYGEEDVFYENVRRKNSSANNREFQSKKDVFMSDINIEDYYRFLFGLEYKNESISLNKAYLDIESDSINAMGDFPELGECPINAVAILDERTKTVYQFLLKNYKNPLIDQYEETMKNPEMYKKLKDFIVQSVGGWKQATRMGIIDLEYKLLFYDEEIKLITDVFKTIFYLDPDVLEIWNWAFDLNYFIARIEVLGYNPYDIMCDPKIPNQFMRFYVDQRNYNDYAERGDFFAVSQTTVWLDQMIQFASRRKGQPQFSDFKLDSIGYDIAKVNKLDYSNITTNISMLPYLDYTTFSWYNIMDVIVQKCIEAKTNDVDYIFNKCLTNNTRYAKGHRQSVYLANRFAKEFYDYGFIIGNNVNRWNEKPQMKFPGALVGDPKHNSAYAMVKLYNRPILLAMNVIDYDYKALYPSIILEHNIATNTQIGRYELPYKVHDGEHLDMYNAELNVSEDDEGAAKYSRGGEMFDNLMSENILEFCRRWLHLGDFKDVVHDMEEYFDLSDEEHTPEVPIKLDIKDAVYFTNSDKVKSIKDMDGEYDGKIQSVKFYNSKPDTTEVMDTVKKEAFI